MSAQKGRGRKTTQAILKEGVSPQHLQVRRPALHPTPAGRVSPLGPDLIHGAAAPLRRSCAKSSMPLTRTAPATLTRTSWRPR